MRKLHKTKLLKHLHKIHIKHSFSRLHFSSKLHPLLLRKKDKLFYLIFFITNILLFSLFAVTLTSFALSSKLYPPIDQPSSPLFMLFSKFRCSYTINIWLCNANLGFLVAIMAFVETFFIFKLLHLRKKMHKGTLAIYILFMQLLSLMPLIIFALTPLATIAGLTLKADWDIHQSLNKLSNPSELKHIGVETSLDRIAAKLSTSPLKNFSISESNPLRGAVLSYFHIAKTGNDTLFARAILPMQLNKAKQDKITLPSGLLFFPDNTLVIVKFDKKTVEKLVPILANRMVLTTFHKSQRSPHISFLDNKDYNTEEKKQEDALKKKQLEYISYLEGFITDSDTIIVENQKIIASYPSDKQQAEKDYNDYSSQYTNWYSDCTSQLGNDPVCEKGRNTINGNLLTLKQNIQIVDDNYKAAQTNLVLQTQYKQAAITDLATVKQNYQDLINSPITAELQDGVFMPPDNIAIRYYDKTFNSFSSYVTTTLHEYLHFYSSNSDKNLDPFLEEGITDAFKVVISHKYLDADQVYVSYIDEVEVINDLLNYLPKDILVSFYFDKDQSEFERWFSDRYGEDAYKTFMMDAKSLTYTSLDNRTTRKNYVKDMEAILDEMKISTPSAH